NRLTEGLKEPAGRLADMVFINRVCLACLCFVQLQPTEDWIITEAEPPHLEAIFRRPIQAVELMKSVEAVG
ncbi:MAG: hypothetical protein V2B18_18240, partial [Pseudomonadota bacterium]